MKKIATLILSVTLCLLCNPIFAEPIIKVDIAENEKCILNSLFELSTVPDILIGGVGLGLTTTALVLEHQNNFSDWNGVLYDKSEVNAFDRLAMFSYNDTLHNIATATTAISLGVIPVAVFASEALCGNLPTNELVNISVMYLESFFLSYGLKDLLKCGILRTRPYMYFEGYPEDKISDHDFEMSFPSGHTTNAFVGASFLSYVFCEYYPNSSWKIPVVATSYAIAAATGVMRVLSGNHFMTDVLGGAVLGTVCGIGVPLIHQLIAKNNSTTSKGNDAVENKFYSSISPLGINFCIKF